MAKRLYFGGLSYDTTDESLQQACAAFGTVASATVIKDKFSGRSRGFGFAEMSTDEEAQKVIAGLNGKDLDGRTVTVSEARPQRDRSERGGGNDRGRSW